MATEISKIHLPTEIWASVFIHLGLNCLRHSALTCSSLRWIARPYLYQNLTIFCEYPWQAQSIQAFQSARRKGVSRPLERLRFFTSPDIAPLVRKCSIQFQLWPDIPLEPVLNFLCENLHYFVNLRRLEFHNILISSKRVENISTLPSLQSLVLIDCKLPQIEPVNSTISTLSLTVSQRDYGALMAPPRWLSLVDSEKLLELQLVTTWATLDTLSEFVDTRKVFPHLHILRLNRDGKVIHSPSLSAFVSQCPALSHLHFLRKPEPDRPSEVTMLSKDFCYSWSGLSVYDGPHCLITSFHGEQLRNLRRIRLFGDRWDGTCDLIGIREDLWHLHHGAPHLESLHLRAFPTSEMCTMIANLFPSLRSLAFSLPSASGNAQDPMLALTREPFLESLIRMVLPPNLKNLLVLGMIFSDQTEGTQVIYALAGKYTSLEHIFLYFPEDFWMTWSITPAMQSCRIPSIIHRGLSITTQFEIPSLWV
ncbi:hypothetical protein BDP27DRAFT_1414244 [Rhodocollybia butyracea]|uniref:F-box domain-containing protein n=1 Tax=Rhodocollybia butyracea TaxID=206335 RepID=A0A9P5Q809_9AGAR|nr:hypothetical protein BDP27DRAFT_1414244 [Rhodocollybia butyracea]